MHRNIRKALAGALAIGLALTSLAGCSKKKTFDTAKALLTLKDGSSVDAGTANLFFRYEQAEFENGFGAFIKNYYGDLWNADLYGTGEPYGNMFKEQVLEDLQHMLLDEKHAGDYGVELSDDEKKAISDAAAKFLADNDAEVLEKMSATTQSVERMLTLYTVKQKVEDAIAAGVDTEVSDEEAAQRTVRYVQFTAQTEAEETEELTEGISENGESVAESLGEEAALETETDVKTQSAGETEVVEEASEAVGENAPAESMSEALTEAATEPEDPAVVAARMAAMAKAEAFLNTVAAASTAEEFEAAASQASADDSSVTSSSFPFGDDDTYPDAAIIEATKGLEDNALVGYPVQAGESFYVLFVADAFDEEATQEKKEEIVDQRKSDAINDVYEEWAGSADESFEFDSAAWSSLIYDIALNYETEPATEALTEGAGEEMSESVAEFVTE